jgi:hypothetical protein
MKWKKFEKLQQNGKKTKNVSEFFSVSLDSCQAFKNGSVQTNGKNADIFIKRVSLLVAQTFRRLSIAVKHSKLLKELHQRQVTKSLRLQ